MVPRWAPAAALLLAGLATLAYASTLGQVAVALVLVFPVIIGTGPLGFLGGLLVMAGLVAAFWALAGRARGEAAWPEAPSAAGDDARAEPTRGSSAGGFLLLGPIPIAFGTTRHLAATMLALAVLVLAALLLLPLLLGRPS